MPSFPRQWPEWAPRLIGEIRKIDLDHPIVIEPGPGGLCWGSKTFPPLQGEKLIYSVHQYQPYEYSHQGVADIRNTDLAKTFPDRQKGWPGRFPEGGEQWDKARLEKELRPVMDFQDRNPGTRVDVGKFSVIRWAPDCATCLRDNLEIFEARGWDWTFHALHEYSGWSPDYDDSFSTRAEAAKAPAPSARGQVLSGYLRKN